MSYIYKCIACLYSFFVISAYNHAQLPEKGDWTTRVGIKNPAMVPDLHQKVFNHPPFYTPRKELTYSDYMEYYESFKKLADSAPYINWNFYGGKFSDEVRTDLGNRTIYESILDSIPDMAIRMVLVEDFLALARNMVDNLDSINVVRNNRDTTVKAADDTLSLPVAMTKYAHLYYKYAGNPICITRYRQGIILEKPFVCSWRRILTQARNLKLSMLENTILHAKICIIRIEIGIMSSF